VRANQPGDPLTARQKLVFDFVKSRIEGGFAPTLLEIGGACYPHCTKGTSITSAQKCLKAIMDKGYLKRPTNLSRHILLTELGKQ